MGRRLQLLHRSMETVKPDLKKIKRIAWALSLASGKRCLDVPGEYIWAYPGQPGGERTIAVHPHEISAEEVEKCAGVCSDEIEKYKEKL